MPVAPILGAFFLIYVPAAVVVRRQLRVMRLHRRGWRWNARGELSLDPDDDRETVTNVELLFSSWRKILDEHPIIEIERARQSRAKNHQKGGWSS